MTQRLGELRPLELGGGRVTQTAVTHLALPSGANEYVNAQIDDYGGVGSRGNYPWLPGVRLTLEARFSHEQAELAGTAGFGFWNAPFGDPSVRTLALPQAAWFFLASSPSDLPLAIDRPGRGWFASTIDATRSRAWVLAPLAPVAVLLNQSETIRDKLWPAIREQLSISFSPVDTGLTAWHSYQLDWQADGCRFLVDDQCILQTRHSPKGPLGFVCWIDNQYLIATPRGRFAWGIVPTTQDQWLEVRELKLDRCR